MVDMVILIIIMAYVVNCLINFYMDKAGVNNIYYHKYVNINAILVVGL